MNFIRLIKANRIAKKVAKHYLNERAFYRYRKTRVPCSCWMCRNPRSVFGNGEDGKTRQEMKQKLELYDYEDNI